MEAATATVGPIGQMDTQVGTQVTTQVRSPADKLTDLTEFCSVPRSRKEMQEFCGIKTTEYFRKHIIRPMLQNGMIRQTIPDKADHSNRQGRMIRVTSSPLFHHSFIYKAGLIKIEIMALDQLCETLYPDPVRPCHSCTSILDIIKSY